MYNPYQHAFELGIKVEWVEMSPDRRAYYEHSSRTIFLREDLSVRVANCTLAHEIVHAEFEDDDRVQGQDWEKIERRCDAIAAKRLVVWPQLVEAMLLSDDPRVWCADLVLTPWALENFFRDLTPQERIELEKLTGHDLDRDLIIERLKKRSGGSETPQD